MKPSTTTDHDADSSSNEHRRWRKRVRRWQADARRVLGGLSPTDAAVFDELLAQTETPNGRPVLAVAGAVNASKSSILNALCDQEGLFATLDAPCTVTTQRQAYEGWDLVDTPGVDRSMRDDAVADAGLFDADLLLFVIDATDGEMAAADHAQLKQFLRRFPEARESRAVVLLGKADNVSNLAERAAVTATVRRQWREAAGHDPELYWISSRMYFAGKRLDAPQLLADSGVPALRAIVQGRLPWAAATRHDRSTTACAAALTRAVALPEADACERDRELASRDQDAWRWRDDVLSELREALCQIQPLVERG